MLKDARLSPPSPGSGNISSQLPAFPDPSVSGLWSSVGIDIQEAKHSPSSDDGNPIRKSTETKAERSKRENGQQEISDGNDDLPRWRILQQEVRNVKEMSCL